MSEKFKNIFSDGQNHVSDEMINAYVAGTLSAEEKHYVERCMAEDEFLNDAIEGLMLAKNKEKIIVKVEEIKSELPHKQARVFRLSNFQKYAIAASILLAVIIGTTYKYFLPDQKAQSPIADVQVPNEEPAGANESAVLEESAKPDELSGEKTGDKIIAMNKQEIKPLEKSEKSSTRSVTSSLNEEVAKDARVTDEEILKGMDDRDKLEDQTIVSTGTTATGNSNMAAVSQPAAPVMVEEERQALAGTTAPSKRAEQSDKDKAAGKKEYNNDIQTESKNRETETSGYFAQTEKEANEDAKKKAEETDNNNLVRAKAEEDAKAKASVDAKAKADRQAKSKAAERQDAEDVKSSKSSPAKISEADELFNKGLYSEALNSYKKIKSSDPLYPEARWKQALCLEKIKDYEACRIILDEIIKSKGKYAAEAQKKLDDLPKRP